MILGNKEIAGNLILAPLAGYSDRAFRKVCRKNGAAIAAVSYTHLTLPTILEV